MKNHSKSKSGKFTFTFCDTSLGAIVSFLFSLAAHTVGCPEAHTDSFHEVNPLSAAGGVCGYLLFGMKLANIYYGSSKCSCSLTNNYSYRKIYAHKEERYNHSCSTLNIDEPYFVIFIQ